jgi:hypothetical protein
MIAAFHAGILIAILCPLALAIETLRRAVPKPAPDTPHKCSIDIGTLKGGTVSQNHVLLRQLGFGCGWRATPGVESRIRSSRTDWTTPEE